MLKLDMVVPASLTSLYAHIVMEGKRAPLHISFFYIYITQLVKRAILAPKQSGNATHKQLDGCFLTNLNWLTDSLGCNSQPQNFLAVHLGLGTHADKAPSPSLKD